MAASGKTIRVAAAQLPATTLDKASQALHAVCSAIDQAAAEGADLLVLPECAYPAYVLPGIEAYRSAGVLPNKDFIALLSEWAGRHGLHLVCGFVEDRSDGLRNAAVLTDDAGEVVGVYRKTFLWGDDNRVFTPGEELPVFDTRLGRIGMAICADVRAPEVTAALAHQGAQIVAVPTCWVNVPRSPGDFYNPQPDFMIQARSRELALPFVCANKYGMETDDIGYCGYSLIVDAGANVLAKAPPDESAVLTADLHLRAVASVKDLKRGPGRPPSMRRAKDLPALPDWTWERICSLAPAEQPHVGEGTQLVLAAVPTSLLLPFGDEQRRSGPQCGSVGYVNEPDLPDSQRRSGRQTRPQELNQADPLQALAQQHVEVVASSLPTADIAESMMVYARSLGMRVVGFPFTPRVLWDRFGSYAVVPGDDVLSFAPTRALALDGAAILFVTDMPDDVGLLRTRAAENRVYLVGTSPTSAVVIAPDGSVTDRCTRDDLRPLITAIDLRTARDKYAFPDTHIFQQRRPNLYAAVFRRRRP